LFVLGVFSLLTWGLKFGIDFTGGTLMEIKFNSEMPATSDISEKLQDLNLNSLIIQPTQNQSLIIRYGSEDEETNEKVFSQIKKNYPESVQLRIDYINASISNELKSKSFWAIFWACAGIMAYIAYAFRKVSRPVASWKYGAGAVIALIHDVFITIVVFSILGHFKGTEIDIPFIAALLTILGFSVHDTIVVYDRTRENLLRSSSKEKFPEIVNRSLNETLVRSINTSLTVLITLIAIYIFGGESVQSFSLALIIGITVGTYSSIFIATALLVTSYEWQLKKAKN
jgi:preprotein translocase subunit SecF